MSGIDGYLIDDKQQRPPPPPRQQHSADALSLNLGNMSDIHLANLSNRGQNDTTDGPMSGSQLTALTYKISLGLICACLCLLTVTGNFLVLLTFRRLRTVSIRIRRPAAKIEFPLTEVVSRGRCTCHHSLMRTRQRRRCELCTQWRVYRRDSLLIYS